MLRFWRTFLGIDRSPGVVAEGGARLELSGLPRGAGAVVLIVAAVLLLFLIWRLYRWERRELSMRRRVLMVGLRAIVLASAAAILLEPVWVSSLRETARSRLLLVLDDSESMKFSDPYTDESRAAALAADLKLETRDGRSPIQRLRETPRLDLVKLVLGRQLEALARGRTIEVYNLAPAIGANSGLQIPDSKIPDSKIPDSKIQDSKIQDSKISNRKIQDPKIQDSKIQDSDFARVPGPESEKIQGSRSEKNSKLESHPGPSANGAESAEPGGPSPSSSPERLLGLLEPKRPVSPIGDALREALAAHRGQPIAGIVLATDGRSNAGEPPLHAAEAAVRLGVPIFAIAAGASEGPRNVRLAELEASPVVFVRDPTNLAVVVESRGLADVEATVVLERRVNQGDWSLVGTQRVVLGEDGVLKRALFRATPDSVGQYEFRARVEDAGPELTEEDNVATAAVKVVRQRVRVLMIAGGPSPEVQFLRNALMRDQHVEFTGWIQHADPGFRQPGDRPIARLPNDASELRHYDVLLLVDPDVRALSAQWPEMIVNFVGKEAGGLIFVAGELHSQQLFETAAGPGPGGHWTRLLPVVRDPGLFRTEAQVRLGSQSTYALELTPEGRGDPIFEFNPDPIRNRAVLTSLPGMYWSFPVTRARPGATVLARHGDPRMQNQYGRQVLLASQFYGPGRSVFIGFDSTYRWRYLSEDYFDGFWARLVDRVGRNKALGGRFPFEVHPSKGTYRVGDRVSIDVRYTDTAATAEATELAAELEIAGRPPEPLRFERVADDPSTLTANFTAEQAGAYSLRVVPAAVADAGSGVQVSTTTFRVEPPRREVDEPSLNRPLLAELARLTRGRVFDLNEVDQLDGAVPMREITRTYEARDELWDAPVFFVMFVLALTAEWVLRKVYHMV